MKVSENEFPKVILKEGTTPPASASGDQVLFIDSSDHLLKSIDAAGVVRKVQGSLRTLGNVVARQTSSQVIATGSGAVGTIVNFDSVVSDAANCVTTGASWKYTAPRSALYSISGLIDLNFGSNVYMNLYLNGINQGIIGHTPSDGANARCLFSATIQMAAGDYFSVQCLQYSGGNRSTNIGAKPPYNTYISVTENIPLIMV